MLKHTGLKVEDSVLELAKTFGIKRHNACRQLGYSDRGVSNKREWLGVLGEAYSNKLLFGEWRWDEMVLDTAPVFDHKIECFTIDTKTTTNECISIESAKIRNNKLCDVYIGWRFYEASSTIEFLGYTWWKDAYGKMVRRYSDGFIFPDSIMKDWDFTLFKQEMHDRIKSTSEVALS